MNTIGVKNSDSWVQFLKLTQEARGRNDGLSSVNKKSSVKSSAFLQTMQRAQSVSNSAYTAKNPVTRSIIVGGNFDAYA